MSQPGEVGTALRVLLVEAREECARALARLLRRDGCQVLVAREGFAALRSARDEPPDVVLLFDLAPPGTDGWAVAAGLRRMSAGKRPLMIAVTDLDRPEDRWRSDEAGIDLHLTKPVDLDRLLSVLRRFWSVLCPAGEGV